MIFLSLHVCVWFAAGVLFNRLNVDMLEMFVWGQEFQWGYHKHPPFPSWVVGGWFALFPRTPQFFLILTQANVALGLTFSYLLARELLEKSKALVAILLLELVVYHSFSGLTFCNNSILVSLWPAFAFFAFRALKHNHIRDWALAGFIGGLAMLSKYPSILLLIAAFVAFVINHKKNFMSQICKPGPLICLAVFLIMTLPHLYWLVHHDFMPMQYAANRYFKSGSVAFRIIEFITVNALILSPIILIGKLTFKIPFKTMFRPNFSTLEKAFVSSIVYVPSLLMIVGALLFKAELGVQFATPFYFLFGVFIVSKAAVFSERSVKIVTRIVYAFLAFILCLFIIFKIILSQFYDKKEVYHMFYAEPIQALPQFIEKEWKTAFPGTPLKYVAGGGGYLYTLTFFCANHPSALLDFDEKKSPWIEEGAIQKDGATLLCQNAECIEKAKTAFKSMPLEWKKVTINGLDFEYAFVGPKKF